LWVIVSLNFLLVHFMPGDPVAHIIGESEYMLLSVSSPEVIEEVRAEYGLDRSVAVQYATYLAKVAQLDFGNSYRTKLPVMPTILFHLKWTFLLSVLSTIVAAFLGGFLGLWTGYKGKGRSLSDRFLTPIMLFFQTIPFNCLAIVLLLVFAFHLELFPVSGITSGGLHGLQKMVDVLWHMALPACVLILHKAPADYMMMKSAVLTVAQEEYIPTAIGKGLTENQVLFRHLAKNALSPYITFVSMQFGGMFSGAMLVEIVFSWKGMGMLIYNSVTSLDFPMLHASFLIISVCVVMFNLIADFLCALIDPRLRERVVYET
jgi:peptide/nickel transport system permease protein